MSESKEEILVTTPTFRVSYPAIFEPRANKMKRGELEFSVMAIFKLGENLDAMRRAAHAACVTKFGPDKTKWPAKLTSPFKTEKSDGSLPDALEKGAIFMSFAAKSKYPPVVVDQNMQEIIEPRMFYAGCYAKARVQAYAYAFEGVKFGVSFGLRAVQLIADGEPLGGSRVKIEDAFQPVAGGVGGASSPSSAQDLF